MAHKFLAGGDSCYDGNSRGRQGLLAKEWVARGMKRRWNYSSATDSFAILPHRPPPKADPQPPGNDREPRRLPGAIVRSKGDSPEWRLSFWRVAIAVTMANLAVDRDSWQRNGWQGNDTSADFFLCGWQGGQADSCYFAGGSSVRRKLAADGLSRGTQILEFKN